MLTPWPEPLLPLTYDLRQKESKLGHRPGPLFPGERLGPAGKICGTPTFWEMGEFLPPLGSQEGWGGGSSPGGSPGRVRQGLPSCPSQARSGSVSAMEKERGQARHGDHTGQHPVEELKAWAGRSEMGREESERPGAGIDQQRLPACRMGVSEVPPSFLIYSSENVPSARA